MKNYKEMWANSWCCLKALSEGDLNFLKLQVLEILNFD